MTIAIKTQSQLDAAIASGERDFNFIAAGRFEISAFGVKVAVAAELQYDVNLVALKNSRVEAWGSSSVVAWGSSRVVARGSSRVVARESSSVEARESSSVVAWGSSRVEAWGSSRVEAWGSSSVVARESSSVVAWGSSRVVAWESSRVVARESSSVEARESSSVVARESSRVVARESSRVVAWESSSVEARESSSVVARESSRVVAWESSSVEAWGSSRVEASGFVSLTLWGKTIAKLSARCHAFIHSAQVKVTGGIKTKAILETPKDWCEYYGVKTYRGLACVYKAVVDDYRSNHDWDFKWTPGTKPEAKKFDDKECSYGLHFSPHPQMTKEFVTNPKHYLECWIKIEDMRVFFNGSYPAKCKAPRVVKPVIEVDIDCKPIKQKGDK